MIRDGVPIQRETTGPVHVPADVEIDFDIEDAEGFVYLWGALVTDGDAAPSFQATISWEALDEDSERALAQAFVDWLRDIRDRAAAEGRTVLAYHYTSYEPEALRRILGPDAVADVLELFADLYAIVAAHYFGAAGLGLKKVALHSGSTGATRNPVACSPSCGTSTRPRPKTPTRQPPRRPGCSPTTKTTSGRHSRSAKGSRPTRTAACSMWTTSPRARVASALSGSGATPADRGDPASAPPGCFGPA